ncbi:DUF31 family putative serine protease [Mycoplasmopsis agassizii]|uniref:DUF31 domain-containing protein n=1 Tax=Mycoplasmopsis agassizii TaxID=33922 RepID=A0ABX4H497_9BACT|nr:lipoprotein 17-related variable surface protein [Mycoplasmopsis agassizii]PAF54701.1 hypothetical protein CJF60_03100 [Mycoplasmopsis agassizii]SMC15985.1 Lipoprotein associated domain-containing protein [Mycoplasmopsis agassizii]
MAKINKKRFLINSLLTVAISSAPVILIACSQVSDPVDLPPKKVQDPVKVDTPKEPDKGNPSKKDADPKSNKKDDQTKTGDTTKIDKKDDQTKANEEPKNIKKDEPIDSTPKAGVSGSTTTKTEEPKKDDASKQELKSGSTSEPKDDPNKIKDEPVTQAPKDPEKPQKPVFPEQNSIIFTIKNKVLPSEINNSNFDDTLTNSIDTSEFKMTSLSIINFDDAKGETEFSFKLQDKKTKEFSETEYNFKVTGLKTILEDLNSRDVVFSPKNSSLKPSQVTTENFEEKISILGLKSGETFILDNSFNFEKDDQKGTLKIKYKLQKDSATSTSKEETISLSALTPFNPDISFTEESKKALVEAKKYASEVTIADLKNYLKWSDTSNTGNDSKASELIFSDLNPDNAKHQLSFRYLAKNKYGQGTTVKKVVYVRNFKDVDQFLVSESSEVKVSLTDLAKTKTQAEITNDLRNYNKYFRFSFKSKDMNLIANPFAINKSSDGQYMLGYNLYLQSDRNIRKRLFLKFGGLKEDSEKQESVNTPKLAPTISSIKKFDSDNMYNFFKVAQSDEAQQNLTASIDVTRTGEERQQFEFLKDRTIALHVNFKKDNVWNSLGGTGWLIGKASNSTDWTDPDFYSYYVATNLHVYTAFLERKLEHPESTYSWSTFKQYGNKDEFMRRLNSKGNWDDTQTALTGADYNYSSEIDFIYAAQGLQAKVNNHSQNGGETLTKIKTFDEYEKTKEVEQKLGVDFAVMKINLLSEKQKELLAKVTDKTDSRKWIKQLKEQALTESSGDTEKDRLWNVRFIETLASNTPTSFKDLSFAITTFNPDSDGYDKTSEDLKLTGLIGTFPATVVPNIVNTNNEKYQLYSGEHNEKIGSGFILTKINKIDFMVQFNGLKNVDREDPLEVVGSLDVYEKNGEDTKEKSTKHSHISVSKSVRFLNVGGGSSGSVLFSKDDNSVLGIYRGVSLQTKDRSKWPPNSKIFGQIVQLRVKGYYDVIGGKTPLEDTPANHTLYDTIKKLNQDKGGDQKYRIPDFR